MTDTVHAENPRAVIGNNAAPRVLIAEHIEDLFAEARLWLDGKTVETEPEAEKIALLMDEARKAKKAADEARKTENRPFDEGKARVQAIYNPLLGKCDTLASVCKDALKPYLEKLEAEKLKAAEAARVEAENATIAAQAAFRASGPTDLEMREEAERLANAAKTAEAAAKRAEKDKAHLRGGQRAVGLRSTFTATVTDETEFARWVWRNRSSALSDFLRDLAARLVREGARELPGVSIQRERKV